MRSERAPTYSPLPAKLVGALMLIVGIVLPSAGIYLGLLEQSWFFLAHALFFVITSVLLFKTHPGAIAVYALGMIICTAWAVAEVHLDQMRLLPRLTMWFVFGLILLLPWVRRPLHPKVAPVAVLLLTLAVVTTATVAVLSQLYMMNILP
ncbi:MULTISPECIES: hypothetical protein [Pseudomonas]|jgi:quinoprotein glucose dehydrogenase|uniref:Uncharacterized protein n=1 Tax=Pseudomonas marincola TaxID=437900 RepID=A0A1I6XQQ0_9PSED|nr:MULTISPECIES: hypothetical protein [Pseudomonas]MAB99918.1 hypothetical protein [Pseudomonadaceae bacterium]OEO26354.1 hypothetical protein AX279_05900 [Pseudomonas sp. J237]CAE6927446.1 conserved membrane protein of unknown function [Pseudomonas marincola]SFT40372.1 quinoprotein glucose dehydrogenase [Pseudomonas marincola]